MKSQDPSAELGRLRRKVASILDDIDRIITATAAVEANPKPTPMPKKIWTPELDELLVNAYDIYPLWRVAELVRLSEHACKARLGILKHARHGQGAYYHKYPTGWRPCEDVYLKACYADTPIKVLISALPGRDEAAISARVFKLGIKRTAEQALEINRIHNTGKFKKGTAPPNKGKKGWQAGGRAFETQFKKGSAPHNALPVGTETVITDSKGRKYLKVKVEGEPKLVFKAHWVWTQANGPIPAGSIIRHRDGDTMSCDLDNLMCITKAENAAINRKVGKGTRRTKYATDEERKQAQRDRVREYQARKREERRPEREIKEIRQIADRARKSLGVQTTDKAAKKRERLMAKEAAANTARLEKEKRAAEAKRLNEEKAAAKLKPKSKPGRKPSEKKVQPAKPVPAKAPEKPPKQERQEAKRREEKRKAEAFIKEGVISIPKNAGVSAQDGRVQVQVDRKTTRWIKREKLDQFLKDNPDARVI